MANTEFDHYNTNVDGNILGEIVIHLTTKSFFLALDPVTVTIMISKIVLKRLPTLPLLMKTL